MDNNQDGSIQRTSDGKFKAGPWGRKTKWIQKSCPTCGKGFEVKPSLDRVKYCSQRCAKLGKPGNRLGQEVSPETRLKQRNAKLGIRGPKHWNWKGGTRSERKRAMARDEYVQWRNAVFQRDNFTCQKCHAHGCELHADHILAWATHPELRYEIENGRTLCVTCHWNTDSFPKQLIPKSERRKFTPG